MHPQRHVILRQTLELSIARSADSWPLQQQVSSLMRKFEVVLESRCNELSLPDRLHRIDCLELDLGCLDPDCLEEELIEKFDQALRRDLAEQIRQQEVRAVPPQTASQLELFTQFIRQGSLPWWANLSQTGLPQESLDLLLRAAPNLLNRLLPDLLIDPTALLRLTITFDDRQLTELTRLLAPALGDFPEHLSKALLCISAPLPNISLAQFRNSVWQSILASLGSSSEYLASCLDFSRAVLMRLAHLQAVPYLSLLQGFVRAAATSPQQDIKEIAAGLAAESGIAVGMELLLTKENNAEEAIHSPQWGSDTGEAALESLCRWVAEGDSEATPSWLQSWPEALRLALFVRLGEQGINLQAAVAELRCWFEQGTQSTMPLWLQSWPMLLREEFSAQLWQLGKQPATATNPIQKLRHERLNSSSSTVEQEYWEQILEQAKFSETDAIYLNNAGLVILWPFLTPFFRQLGLLQHNYFRDEAARVRAVAMLQYLACGDATVPEYLLPLNKLLCGMALEAVFELEQPLTEDEIAAGEGLLEAVIEQAPILNNMSVPGFRGSFLLRAGILQMRDGTWLLRVERETYDLVLDRFPWGFSWVRLPWMKVPLQVEW